MLRIVTLLIAIIFSAAPAIADKFDDCRQPRNVDKRIKACTEIIETMKSETALATAYARRARGHRDKGHLDQAIADFDRAIEIQPDNQIYLHDRGTVHNDKGQHEKAIADFNRSIENNSKYVNAYLGRAKAHEALGNVEAAIADYRKAIANDPKHMKGRAQLKRLGAGR